MAAKPSPYFKWRVIKTLWVICAILMAIGLIVSYVTSTQGREAVASRLFRGNRATIDTIYTYKRATVQLQDGTVVTGEVDQWLDYEESDMLQVIIDGVAYLVHSSNCTLISK